ncbi:MAG: FtsK/SpoIIIE domain-containing protein [Propionibacteriaceae bacterium]|nr:FtsK/SpoIIIE domain-containing protein [Propionibacteriaceae bacterium]
MKQKLTVTRGQQQVDLLVTADGTATVGDIAAALAVAHPTDPAPAVEPGSVALRVSDGVDTSQGRVLPASTPLLDSGLRSGMHVEVIADQSRGSRPHGQTAAVLRVVFGPDLGMEVSLPFGSSTIGRGRDNDVVLTDELVSKFHARVMITEVVEVIDQHSANGVMVGGQVLPRVQIGSDDVAILGDTGITISQVRRPEDQHATSTDIEFVRSPNILPHVLPRKFPVPNAPGAPRKQPFPFIAMVSPLIMGLVMYVVNRSLMSIIYVALSPIMMIGNFVDHFSREKRQFRASVRQFVTSIKQCREYLAQQYDKDRAELLTIYPSIADLWSGVVRLGTMLWWRRPEHPEFLRLRLGLGDIPAFTEFENQPNHSALPEYVKEVEALIKDFSILEDAPVVVDLKVCGALGLCGNRSILDGVARAVMVQLICSHSPAEVVVACLTSRTALDRWSWLQWLPHTSSPHSPLGDLQLACDEPTGIALLSRLEDLIESRGGGGQPARRGPLTVDDLQVGQQDTTKETPPLPWVVVLVDGTAVDQARLTLLTERGPDVGVFFIMCATSSASLPASCRTILEVGEDGSKVGRIRQGDRIAPVRLESVDTEVSDQLARILAPVMDAGVPVDDSSDLPRSISMVSLTGQDLATDPQAVIARWRENQSIIDRTPGAKPVPLRHPVNLRAPVGHIGSGIFTLDLKTQGPHALVGGTTGAGKSEFLQAWVLGMAVGHSPDQLSFLFVDYKGGSAFARCLDLPHVVGLVTDLSTYLVRRALTSLRAELRFREHLLNEKSAKDLAELEQRGDPDCPPSLIIVVDEFAALATEIPEFVDGVVDVAQRGRSLGMHLIMATQRPAGVIKDNLRANTNLRVALRMADESDSEDVIGEKTSAYFEPSTPGRGAAKTGPGRIIKFQSGYPGAKTPDHAVVAPVNVSGMTFGIPQPWRVPEVKVDLSSVDSDIERLVSTMVQGARIAQIPAPRKPWLEDLAQTYDLARLPGHRDDQRLVLGVLDDPDAQKQPVVFYEPDRDGNLAILGASGSGKTAALRTIVASSVFATRSGGPVWVYGLDFASGGLNMLETLPSVGAIIKGDDEERVIRLLRMLKATVDERVVRYSAVSAAGIVDYRKLANAPQEPRILLLVDGMSSFREEYEFSNRYRWFTAFAQIAADGRPLGVHVIMTGDRGNSIPNSIAATVQRRIILRMVSEDDYMNFGVPKDILTAASPPGRGIWNDNEIQMGILGANSNVAVQARAMDQLAQAASQRSEVLAAPGIAILPAEIPLSTLAVVDERGYPVFAMADDDLAGVGVEPRGAFLIAGPPGAGRTTALATLGAGIWRHAQAGYSRLETILLAPSRTTLPTRAPWGRVARGEEEIVELAEKLLEELAGGSIPTGRYAVIIESITEFTGTSAESVLDRLIQALVKNEQFVVGEGEVATWGQAWNLAKQFKAARRGMVLTPGESDADTLTGTNVGRIRVADFPPGRGFIIGGGTARKIQVALAD